MCWDQWVSVFLENVSEDIYAAILHCLGVVQFAQILIHHFLDTGFEALFQSLRLGHDILPFGTSRGTLIVCAFMHFCPLLL